MTPRPHAFGTQSAQTRAVSLDSLDRRGWWLATTLYLGGGNARARVPGEGRPAGLGPRG